VGTPNKGEREIKNSTPEGRGSTNPFSLREKVGMRDNQAGATKWGRHPVKPPIIKGRSHRNALTNRKKPSSKSMSS
jgi:hypothetical protein